MALPAVRKGGERAMLNEWSDRRPPEPPGPFYRRGDFWLGVFVVFVCLAFGLQLYGCVAR